MDPAFATEDEAVTNQTLWIRQLLSLDHPPGLKEQVPEVNDVVFFVKRCPWSPHGSPCALESCQIDFNTGEYTIGVYSETFIETFMANITVDYHISCFEKIADFKQLKYLTPLTPLTRSTWQLRMPLFPKVFDIHSFCEGGAERLVMEWKVQRWNWVHENLGFDMHGWSNANPAFYNLLYKAGSAGFTPMGPIQGLPRSEEHLLRTILAPIESDGPDDPEEWELFHLINPIKEHWDKRIHDLNFTMTWWQVGVVLATHDERLLTDAGIRYKYRELGGDKGMRAIKRLMTVPL